MWVKTEGLRIQLKEAGSLIKNDAKMHCYASKRKETDRGSKKKGCGSKINEKGHGSKKKGCGSEEKVVGQKKNVVGQNEPHTYLIYIYIHI